MVGGEKFSLLSPNSLLLDAEASWCARARLGEVDLELGTVDDERGGGVKDPDDD